MPRSLPAAPNLEHLKKQAKDLRKSHQNQSADALATLRLLHQFAELSDPEIFASKLSLNEAQLALALDYGFKGWSELKTHVLGREDSLKYLHIHCGDASARPLQSSSVPGDVMVWREIYIEGPAPALPQDEFIQTRAEYISRAMGLGINGVLEGTQTRYKALAEAGKYGEVVLWFDSCMFDQTIMIHVIDLCGQQRWANTKLSLICIDRGLGELSVDELVSLMDTRREVTHKQTSLAREAWRAFTSANPMDVQELLVTDCSVLPYLADAMRRHLQQFPSVHNGLNRTQSQILRAIADGANKLHEIFVAVSANEERPFMGDTSMWACIDELAQCSAPLLTLRGPSSLRDAINLEAGIDTPSLRDHRQWTVTITPTGEEVLASRADHIASNGIDRWLGGVHLQGAPHDWRWDDEKECIISHSMQ